MSTYRNTFARVGSVLGLITLIALTPFAAFAAEDATATFDQDRLVTDSSRPTLSGEAEGTRTVKLIVTRADSDKKLYSRTTRVRGGEWKTRIGKKLSDGVYSVTLESDRKSGREDIATATLVVGEEDDATAYTRDTSATTLSVSNIPLLWGGLARAGQTVPVSYLKVTNHGKESAFISGFYVEQRGTASTAALTRFSSYDDKAQVLASADAQAALENGRAFVPAPLTIEAGQTRLFTLKTTVAPYVLTHVGKQIQIVVSGIQTNAKKTSAAFPIMGTTWTVSAF